MEDTMPKLSGSRASTAIEDYVKAIHALGQEGGPVGTTEIASRLGVTSGSVSTMLKKLDTIGVVELSPYRGVRLTRQGRRLALHVVRRHRLVELFLTEILDLPWERVHAEAEILEHAISDDLLDAIDRKLGHPTLDPHGDPIPSADLQLARQHERSLTSLEIGEAGTLSRVPDREPEMLRYLGEAGIALGDTIELVAREPFDGSLTIRTATTTHSIGPKLAQALLVSGTRE
jgi:DtxR family Mn-dependent transcriptional regulator